MSSCLPLILLGSVPLTLQSEVPYIRSSDFISKRPASEVSGCLSIIETQPANRPTSAPTYRRFDSYESRMSAIPSIFACSDQTNNGVTSRKVRSAPVPLKFEFRSSRAHGATALETEKGRGKKRASDPGQWKGSTMMPADRDMFSDDHVAPFRPSHSSKARATTFAGSSGSTASMQKSPRRSQHLQSPRLQILEEGDVLQPPLSPLASLDPVSPSRRSPKRVSFSSTADRVLRPAAQESQELSGKFSLFCNPQTTARPSASRPASLPSARSQAAGRSILKRTTSFGDGLPSLGSQEFHSTGVPLHEKIQIESLQKRNNQTSKRDSAARFDKSEGITETFFDIDLTPHTQAQLLSEGIKSENERSELSYDARAVRHWSMIGSNWIRRSGLFMKDTCVT
jgi:hypothetical protein